MLKITYEELERVVDENDWDSESGKLALAIEKTLGATYCKLYQNPKNHLINFLNAYEVEKAFIEAYSPHLKWNHEDRHIALQEGLGPRGADFTCVDTNQQVEAKMFRNCAKFVEWQNKSSDKFDCDRGCDVYLVYLMDSGITIVVNPKNKNIGYYEARCQIRPKLRKYIV